jgi:hypothetical protein
VPEVKVGAAATAKAAVEDEDEDEDEDLPEAGEPATAAKPETAGTGAASTAGTANTAGKGGTSAPSKTSEGPSVLIENPVLESASNSLELRFDIKNKLSSARAEGYVWAVAEFKTDKGKVIYIGAPTGIEVRADGEPTYPRKSNKFAVRYFKRKKFSFPVNISEPGTFTGIRIGVMGNVGDERMIYKVPVNIRAGNGTAKDGAPKTNPG